MPEKYYCPDNFFKKMTDLDSPRKNNDCYFYYYSTCAKGDSCTFRHEPSALGCETVCSFWKEGKCLNVHCNYRHMELRKNRKAIPCYWETQPGGCKKPHCPFLHQSPKPSGANDNDSMENNKADSGTESADNTMTEKMNSSHQSSQQQFKGTPSVDSLVVNFEEESDNESVPANSPIKANPGTQKVKSWEEIRLEKVQAESAALYSYPAVLQPSPLSQEMDDLRKRLLDKKLQKNTLISASKDVLPDTVKKYTTTKDVNEIKIKTLAEIRAERAARLKQEEQSSSVQTEDSSVTSTCSDEPVQNEVTTSSSQQMPAQPTIIVQRQKTVSVQNPSVRRKLIRQRLESTREEPPRKRLRAQNQTEVMEMSVEKSEKTASEVKNDNNGAASSDSDEDMLEQKLGTGGNTKLENAKTSQKHVHTADKQDEPPAGTTRLVEGSKHVQLEKKMADLDSESKVTCSDHHHYDQNNSECKSSSGDKSSSAIEIENISMDDGADCPSNRTFDEVLLLQDDDESSNVSMKEEDELLNESDSDL